jgi:hypothetical protein
MDTSSVKFYSLICTRNYDYKQITKELISVLRGESIAVNMLVGFNSIFEAYNKGFKKLNANPDDIIILCHDDIQIYLNQDIKTILNDALTKDTGFVGVAGTKQLFNDAIWWNWYNPQHMSGKVIHGSSSSNHLTTFGDCGQVAVLDGLFLACRASTLNIISMIKPITFEGNWDFYDIYYTIQTSLLGLKNKTVPIMVRHESMGELAGRDSWHKNRKAFIEMFEDILPYKI